MKYTLVIFYFVCLQHRFCTNNCNVELLKVALFTPSTKFFLMFVTRSGGRMRLVNWLMNIVVPDFLVVSVKSQAFNVFFL